MKTKWFPALIVSFLALAPQVRASEPVTPSKYLSGPVGRDVAAALKRGTDERRPVWIVAWDEKFQMSPEGKSGNITDYNLKWFYQNPETKKLLADNFIQVFTTFKNPAISQWLDADDKTHVPVFIVIGRDGSFLFKKPNSGDPNGGLKAVQDAIAAVK